MGWVRWAGRFVLSVLILLVAVTGVSSGAEPVPIPGSRVMLAPPPGFVASDRFAGFVSEATGSSITVADLPGEAFRDIARVFTPAAFAQKGMRLRKSEPLPPGSGRAEGLLVEVEQSAGGTAYRKWIAVLGTGTVTALVTFTVPEPALATVGEGTVRDTLLGTRIAAAAAPSALPFTIDPAGSFIRQHELMGNSVLFVDAGAVVDQPSDRPMFIATVSTAPLPDVPLDTFCRTLLTQVAGMTGITVKDGGPIAAGGLSGMVHTADAFNAATGTRTVVWQATLTAADRYYRFVGLAPADRADTAVSAFRRMVASFRPVLPGAP